MVLGVFLYYWQMGSQVNNQGTIDLGTELIDRSNYGLYSQKLSTDEGESFRNLKIYVVSQEADWRRFWQEMVRQPDTGGFADVPDVDFNKKVAIAVLQGIKETGGYYVITKKVQQGKGEILMWVDRHEPAEDELLSQAVSSPYDIFTVDKSEVLNSDKTMVRVYDAYTQEEILSGKISDFRY